MRSRESRPRRNEVRNPRGRLVGGLVVLAMCGAVAACGDDGSSSSGGADATEVRLVTYSSFALPEKAAEKFEEETGAKIRVIASDDSGAMLTKALLSAGSPEGDVIFGIDNTLASRAMSEDLLEPYLGPQTDSVEPGVALDGEAGNHLSPIDLGDVCINVDQSWFESKSIAAPTRLADLTDPKYRDLLVVESPVTSSPGLAFLIGTVARYGDGWMNYWQQLEDNGVSVRQSWDDAYSTDYTVSGGDRPLVVSYASSPPAEVVFSEGKRTEPVSTVMTDSCVSQVEYAGVLSGTDRPELARKLVDFMQGPEWQSEIPLTNFVFPVVADTPLPEEFQKWAVRADAPLAVDAETIGEQRDAWIESWRSIME